MADSRWVRCAERPVLGRLPAVIAGGITLSAGLWRGRGLVFADEAHGQVRWAGPEPGSSSRLSAHAASPPMLELDCPARSGGGGGSIAAPAEGPAGRGCWAGSRS